MGNLGFIVARFVKADEGNDDGYYVEYLANYTADRCVIDVVYYPKR